MSFKPKKDFQLPSLPKFVPTPEVETIKIPETKIKPVIVKQKPFRLPVDLIHDLESYAYFEGKPENQVVVNILSEYFATREFKRLPKRIK